MIENCTKCDPDYGKRIAEGIKKVLKSNQDKMEKAVGEAESMSHPSDPY